MRIIPAIDIIDGKCVRLSMGDYNRKTTYNENPLEVAKQFEDFGIEFLHLVDLDGARSKEIKNYKVLETIASKTSLQIDFGGGLKSSKDVAVAFDSGAKQITGGSVAVSDQDMFLSWIEKYGSEAIILGADCKDRRIATQGWLEHSDIDVVAFIQLYKDKSVLQTICTDISKDGMLQGPALDLYREILFKTETKLVASGGVSSMQDLLDLKAIGCEGAIVGKAIFEGKITLKELSTLC